jgi:hypothetical protein
MLSVFGCSDKDYEKDKKCNTHLELINKKILAAKSERIDAWDTWIGMGLMLT